MLFSADFGGRRPKMPSELATELNNRFQMSDSNEQYFTLLLGMMNRDTRELCYVSAGHPGPIHVPAQGNPKYLDAAGFPIGVLDEPGYQDERMVLGNGDSILVYSDGVLEAQNQDGQFFGKEGLLDCAADRQGSLQSTVRKLEQQLMMWCAGHKPDDDISLLAMSVGESTQS